MGIKLAKYVQDLYAPNYARLVREIKCVHELRLSMLLTVQFPQTATRFKVIKFPVGFWGVFWYRKRKELE